MAIVGPTEDDAHGPGAKHSPGHGRTAVDSCHGAPFAHSPRVRRRPLLHADNVLPLLRRTGAALGLLRARWVTPRHGLVLTVRELTGRLGAQHSTGRTGGQATDAQVLERAEGRQGDRRPRPLAGRSRACPGPLLAARQAWARQSDRTSLRSTRRVRRIAVSNLRDSALRATDRSSARTIRAFENPTRRKTIAGSVSTIVSRVSVQLSCKA